jgi:hypothetical protein
LIVVCEEESANRIAAEKDSTFSNTISIKGILQGYYLLLFEDLS